MRAHVNHYFQDLRPGAAAMTQRFHMSGQEPTVVHRPPVVPGWAAATERWGRTGELPPHPPVGYETQTITTPPPLPGWNDNEPKPRRWVGLLVAGIAAVFLILAGTLIQRSDMVPAGVPLIGKDSGVALCEVMAGGGGPTGKAKTDAAGTKLPEDKIREVRGMFADSRHEAIRINGVRMMDLVVEIQALGSDPGFAALAYVGSFTEAYAGLAGGCAEVGHAIPALSSMK